MIVFFCNKSITKLHFMFQLSNKHQCQSFDERELQHVSCVREDFLDCQHECDLPALSGQHMCTDRRGQLCACEYRWIKKNVIIMQLFISMEGIKVNGYCGMIFAYLCLFLQDCRQKTSRTWHNVVRSAFYSSGPLHKSDEGKTLFIHVSFFLLKCFYQPSEYSKEMLPNHWPELPHLSSIPVEKHCEKWSYRSPDRSCVASKSGPQCSIVQWKIFLQGPMHIFIDYWLLLLFQCWVIIISIKHVPLFFSFPCRVLWWGILQSSNCWTILSRNRCDAVLLNYFFMSFILPEKPHWTLQLYNHTKTGQSYLPWF